MLPDILNNIPTWLQWGFTGIGATYFLYNIFGCLNFFFSAFILSGTNV